MRSIIRDLKFSLLAGCFALLALTHTATAAYNESGGVVVMEVESAPLPAQGWKQATSVVGRSDNASIFGSFYGSTLSSTSTPGKGLISYKVVITTPGDYQLQWRSLISVYNSTDGTFNSSTETTEHNDSFARMLNPSGVSITAQAVPGGANGGVPDKTGIASENWYKAYRNGSGWVWDAKNQDHYPLPLFWTLAPGTYTFQISARSSGHAIDRILLWNRNGSTSYGNKVTGAGNTSASNALPLSVITDGTDTTAPTISSFSPADNATGVAFGANLVATFSENISSGTGNITVKNLTDSTQTTITISDTSQVSISGAVLTINPTANLVGGKNYAIQIAATAIDDTAGNSFGGITNDTTWNFATASLDTTVPTISSFSPADNATGVAFGANLVATFSENISSGMGNITVKNLTDSTQTTITITDTSQASISGAVLTINPTANLVGGKNYSIQIAATAIDDTAGNSFGGITNDTTWNFATQPLDTSPPSPNPMTFAVLPNALGQSSITMSASNATDPGGVEYFFDCTAGGGPDSGWQSSSVFMPTGLTPDNTYTYTVKARDASLNETSVSAPASVTTSVTTPIAPRNLYSSGAKTWNNTTANWGTVTSGPYNTATWSSGDIATFEGTAGTVTLGEAIHIKNLSINAGYTITGSTLNFSSGTMNVAVASTIRSAINGSPNMADGGANASRTYLNPTSGNMTLGAVTRDVDKWLHLQGSSTSMNSIASIGKSSTNAKIQVESGTWTLGNVYAGEFHVIGGNVILLGQLTNDFRAYYLKGGTLHYNNAGAIVANTAFSGNNALRFQGGSLDNSSGSAITTSTTNPHMNMTADWTFIGSNGADSNLFLGNGTVHLGDGTRQVTIQNAATTLAFGGQLNFGGLTKAGPGTLELRGASTYTGATTVNAGTLKMGANNVIPDASNVSVGTATLDADTRTDTSGTLDVTGTAVINLGSGATLAFADSKAVDWTGGTLEITGTLGPTSLRFGNSADDLTSGPGSQLAKISVHGSGLGTYILDANGYLVPGVGGDLTPPTLTSITDNVSGGPVTVGTLVTYTVTFSEDMSAATVTAADFNNAGTAAVTVASVTEITPGVFAVEVTPTSAGSLTLRIAGPVLQDSMSNNLVVPVSDDTSMTVQSAYDAWARGALFDADANGDGVKNGLAWILGAANPTASVLDKQPTVSTVGGNMVFSFQRIQSSINATTALSIEVGTTLTSWPSIYTVGANTAGSTLGVEVAKDKPTAGTDMVMLTVLQAPDAAKFGRLKAVQTP